MRAVVQRVKMASVEVGGEEVGAIPRGLLVLVGFTRTDNDEILRWMAKKIVSLRVFNDGEGKMNLELQAVGGELLVVSQFTLYGDCQKGKRPSFDRSAPPDIAEVLYKRFVAVIKEETLCAVRTGVFQAHMEVRLVNDGPVTLVIEKETA